MTLADLRGKKCVSRLYSSLGVHLLMSSLSVPAGDPEAHDHFLTCVKLNGFENPSDWLAILKVYLKNGIGHLIGLISSSL